MASELQLGESCHACPFIWDAVQPHMPVVIALLTCYIQFLQLRAKHNSQGQEGASCKAAAAAAAAAAFVCISYGCQLLCMNQHPGSSILLQCLIAQVVSLLNEWRT